MADPPKIVTLQQYLNLITSEHNQRPNYMATVALSIQPGIDGVNNALSWIGMFDVDTANGQQLDFVGQWIGVSRYLSFGLDPWFTFEDPALGWNQGKWFVKYENPIDTIGLDDFHYRILLKARIAANYWDGTVPGAYTAWNTLFQGTGYQIIIQDQFLAKSANVHGNMHIIQGIMGPPLDAQTKALFLGGYLSLKSAGVGVGYITQVQPGIPGEPDGIGLPFFAWGCGPAAPPAVYPPTTMAGWDMGAWCQVVGHLLPPIYPPPGSDAPSDSQTYGRQSQTWQPLWPLDDPNTHLVILTGGVELMLGTLPAIPTDAPADNHLYGRGMQAWQQIMPLSGGVMTGPMVMQRIQ